MDAAFLLHFLAGKAVFLWWRLRLDLGQQTRARMHRLGCLALVLLRLCIGLSHSQIAASLSRFCHDLYLSFLSFLRLLGRPGRWSGLERNVGFPWNILSFYHLGLRTGNFRDLGLFIGFGIRSL